MVHVEIPVYENLENKTVPVNPIVTGTPGAGFRSSTGDRRPAGRPVEGDQDQLATLVTADTAPVSVVGRHPRRHERGRVRAAHGRDRRRRRRTAQVTVRIVPVDRDPQLHGRPAARRPPSPDLQYEVSDRIVLLTAVRSTADLDRLDSSPIVIAVNVGSSGPGRRGARGAGPAVGGVTVAAISPETVT